MIRDWKAPILATVGLVSLAIAIPIGVANAQGAATTTQGQRPPDQGGFQRAGQGGGAVAVPGGDMMMQRGMMGGGPATMVTDNQFLYVLQGNTLYKINKNNLEVIGQGMLPMPMPMGRGGFEGGPPGAPGVRAGGGGTPPPTSTRGGGEESKDE